MSGEQIGDGRVVDGCPEDARLWYAAEALGLKPREILEMGWEAVECGLAWMEGRALAQARARGEE